MPETMPVPEPTEAIDGLLLLQVPPLVAWLSVVVAPSHTSVVPVMAVGAVFTVTVVIA